MPLTLTTANQKRWKDCFASSAKTGLTLMSNGEEPVQVYSSGGVMIPAGFDAPTVAPTVTSAGSGVIQAGYAAYRYVYASSQFPNVEAITPAGGLEYPKSNPSPASATFTITGGGKSNNVVVTKTTAAGVDTIFIYRAYSTVTAAEATAQSDAGNLYYVGMVTNDGLAGTVTFVDNVLAPQEQMELDNYTAPQFQYCVYEDPYWWGFGEEDLIVQVTLNGSTSIAAVADAFYVGRNGQTVTFDGITTGGFDSKGGYYFKYLSDSVLNVSTTDDLAVAATIPASGTTTMRVRGFASTLRRSKPRNPFAWGYTEQQVLNGVVTRVPQQYAFPVGGRGSALAVMTDERLLKLDVENPPSCCVLNLNLAGQSGFEDTKRTLDRQYVVSSHFAQFVSSLPGGQTVLRGIDVSNFSLVQATAGDQGPVGDEVFKTMLSIETSGSVPRLFHGVYDTGSELSCFWVKTADDPSSLVSIDTCLCFHGPSGQWSTLRDLDVTASISIFDPVELRNFTLVGTASGQIAEAFVEDESTNLLDNGGRVTTTAITATTVTVDAMPAGIAGSLWVLLTNAASDYTLWVRGVSFVGNVMTVDATFDPETREAAATMPALAVPGYAYFGLINCEARTYFQPSQTKGSQARELWGAFRDADGDLFYRYMQEFDEAGYSSVVTPIQTARSNGDGSVNWIARDVPTPINNQYGYRLIQRGYEPFQVLGLDFKNVTT